jgi:hypothetical protein
MRPEGLGNLIKIIHLIGSRTRDLPVMKGEYWPKIELTDRLASTLVIMRRRRYAQKDQRP